MAEDTELDRWDRRILAVKPAGVDPTQIAENLRLTPTQRVEKLQAALDFAAAVRRAGRASGLAPGR